MDDNGFVPAEEAPEFEPNAATDRRLQRILDHLDESLAKPNALEANLGAVNSDLFLIVYRLKPAIDQALSEGVQSLEELAHLKPAIDAMLKVTKQIKSITQLELKAAAPTADTKLPHAEVVPSGGASEESEI